MYVLSRNISDPLALRHNFMNIDDHAGMPTMSEKSAQFTMAWIGERIKYRYILESVRLHLIELTDNNATGTRFR